MWPLPILSVPSNFLALSLFLSFCLLFLPLRYSSLSSTCSLFLDFFLPSILLVLYFSSPNSLALLPVFFLFLYSSSPSPCSLCLPVFLHPFSLFSLRVYIPFSLSIDFSFLLFLFPPFSSSFRASSTFTSTFTYPLASY